MSHDYALVLDDDGIPTAHQANCISVEHARKDGRPILTMFACAKPLGNAYRKHNCLDEKEKTDA